MNTLGIPPGHRFALCLFLPDPPRGPVPSCFILATGATRRALTAQLETTRQLAEVGDLAWTIPGPDLITRHTLRAPDALYTILAVPEVLVRIRAHLRANELDFHGWLARNMPAPATP